MSCHEKVAKWMESSLLCYPSREKSHGSFLPGYSFTRALDTFAAALPSRLDRASIFLLVSGISSTILSLFRRKSWREEARSQISQQKSLESWGPSYLLMMLFSQLSTPHSPCVCCCSFFKKFIFSLSKIYNKATFWNHLHWQSVSNPEIVFWSPTVPNYRVRLNTLADPEIHPDG